MEIFSQSSKYITKLITEFQNDKIDKISLNKNILLNTIYCYISLKKKNKKNKKIIEEQNKIFYSFFIQEQKQEENEKELLSKIRDRKSKKIVKESLKEQRETLIKDLSSKIVIKQMQDHTYDSFIPPKNISLSLNFELIKKYKKPKRKKYISESNNEIIYINPNFNDKKKIITNDFIEPPYIDDIDFDNVNYDDEVINEKETINNNNDNNDIFIKMINEESDEILFYDEKLCKNEKLSLIKSWGSRLKKEDIKNDFEELKQKKKKNKYNTADNLFFILRQNSDIKNEIGSNSKNNSIILFDEISQQKHYHEFIGYLSEKSYKLYMKKMNYTYLILMLLSYFDFEKFSSNYECLELEQSKSIIIFIKKILLFCGITTNKIYESIMHNISNNKGKITFENYLNFFSKIFELPYKYQFYKYNFLLFLVKKSGFNTISMSNFRLFCNLIKCKVIYEEEIYEGINEKMVPIIKAKYPKDDLDNLNYQHVSIILEFLINYEYGDY